MSVANYPSTLISYSASSAIVTALPATPLAVSPGISVPVLKRADASEIIVNPIAGLYTFFGKCNLVPSPFDTAMQQIELQVVRFNNAAGAAVAEVLASQAYSLNRVPIGVGPFADIAAINANVAALATFGGGSGAVQNITYTLTCQRVDFPVVNDTTYFGIRVLVNGIPVGGEDIENVRFNAIRTAEFDSLKTIVVD